MKIHPLSERCGARVAGSSIPVSRPWLMRGALILVAIVSMCLTGHAVRAAELLYSFTGGTNGMNPRGRLLQGADGDFYGTTEQGGAYGYGAIFKVATNGTLTTLFSFNQTNGANPYGGLVHGADGNFYGTTYNGGASGLGAIFRYTTNGVFTLLCSLNSTGTSSAVGPGLPGALVLGRDGDFYGVIYSGFGSTGSDGIYGKVFKLRVSAGASTGTMTTLVRFLDTLNGAYPGGDLVQGTDGYFYGTTMSGGNINGGYGTIFRVSSNGVFNSLAAFNKTNGARPLAGLVAGGDGKFYGTTSEGGTNDLGTVFQVTTNGVLTSLLSFDGTNGAAPFAPLVQGPDGGLFGTTSRGGQTGNGTVFRVTTNGLLTTLHSLTGDQGAYPYAGLRQGNDGNLYGCTYNGFIFMISTNGVLTNLASFNNGDGATPYAELAVGPEGKLYGTTFNGGVAGHGTLYTVSTNGAVAVLTSFAGTNGANPYAGVKFAGDGTIYGTTTAGSRTPLGNGTLYRANTNGAATAIGNFTGTNGTSPFGGVVLASGGRIFGTTRYGGVGGYGTVFSANTNGSINRLYALTSATGGYPVAGLTLGPDGQLYGVGWAGIPAVFKITTNGNLTTFTISSLQNPIYFYGNLTAGTDGFSLYGTCERDGFGPYGRIYRITTNGIYTTLVYFNNINGAEPRSDLNWGSDGNLYGTTFQGGLFNRGTVFRVTTSGTLTSLLSFDGTNGMNPHASVTLAGDGNFYGATTAGGAFNAGAVYRLRAKPFLISQPEGRTNLAGTSASLMVAVDGVPPFACQWLKDGVPLTNSGNLSGAMTTNLQFNNLSAEDTASYSLSVSNAFGQTVSSPATVLVRVPPAILVNDGNFGFATNGFGFAVSSPTGSVLLLQSSTNLINWIGLATLTNETGQLLFVDPNTNEACQFYRAVWQLPE